MLPLAVVLVLTPPAPPPPLTPQPLAARRLAPCRDSDPGFVHYVAPPRGKGPLWPLVTTAPVAPKLDPRILDFGPATKAAGPIVPPPLRCPVLTPVAAP